MPHPKQSQPDWHTTLDDLLTGRTQALDHEDNLPGAQLVVTDPDRQEVFRAALARHWRPDEQDHNTVWIRPLPAAHRDPTTALPTFDTAIARRRALQVTAAQTHANELILTLATGETAHIQPAAGNALATLQDWDTWLTTTNSAQRALIDTLGADT